MVHARARESNIKKTIYQPPKERGYKCERSSAESVLDVSDTHEDHTHARTHAHTTAPPCVFMNALPHTANCLTS